MYVSATSFTGCAVRTSACIGPLKRKEEDQYAFVQYDDVL
jgi:hypothetical protein